MIKKRNIAALHITLPNSKKPRAERITSSVSSTSGQSITTPYSSTTTTITSTTNMQQQNTTNAPAPVANTTPISSLSREMREVTIRDETVIRNEISISTTTTTTNMTPRELVQMAMELAQQKRLYEAFQYLSKGIEMGTTQSTAFRAFTFFNRGLIQLQLNRFEEASVDFTFALGLGCNDSVTYFSRGSAYLKGKRYQEAINDFTSALSLDPKDLDSLANRGLALTEMRRYEEALHDYSTILNLKPTDAAAYINRCTVLSHLKRYEEALADAQRGMMLEFGNLMYQRKYTVLKELVDSTMHRGWEDDEESDVLWI